MTAHNIRLTPQEAAAAIVNWDGMLVFNMYACIKYKAAAAIVNSDGTVLMCIAITWLGRV